MDTNDNENVVTVDETIDCLCRAVKMQQEAEAYDNVIGLTNALAALITAKANMDLTYRMYSRGGINQKHQWD